VGMLAGFPSALTYSRVTSPAKVLKKIRKRIQTCSGATATSCRVSGSRTPQPLSLDQPLHKSMPPRPARTFLRATFQGRLFQSGHS